MFTIPLPVLKNSSFQIWSEDLDLKKGWIKELKSSGLIFSEKSSWPSTSTKNSLVLCLNPGAMELEQLRKYAPQYFIDHVFCIVSDDNSWKEFALENKLIHLPAHTHPLEVARMLIHELNFKPRQPKPVYVFSLFNF